MWTKPKFKELYNICKDQGDLNSLNAKKVVTSPTIKFSGFPANMGEMGCKMTLEALGEISNFECEEDDTFPVLKGTVTFAEIESAKAAVKQYNGMDMGLGSKLELESV